MPARGTMLTSAAFPFAPVTLKDATRISLGGTEVQPSGVVHVSGTAEESADTWGNEPAPMDEMSGCPGGN